jgi:hypothetical protein
LDDCRNRMALEGCFISPNRDATSPQLIDGIGYLPSLHFNLEGRLTDHTVEYRQEGRITSAQCRTIHERTLDRLTREIGTFQSPVQSGESWQGISRTTANGASYRLNESSEGFVTVPARSHWAGMTANDSRPVTEWNGNAHVSLLSVMFVVDRVPHCYVAAMYGAATSMRRAPEMDGQPSISH